MAITEAQHNLMVDTIEMVEVNSDKLNDWEKNFMKDQAERFEEHGESMYLSSRQEACIQKIYDKLNG